MNRYFINSKSVALLLLVAGGLCSLLFSSCTSSGGQHATTNPALYSAFNQPKELTPATFPESRWPFGPAGFR